MRIKQDLSIAIVLAVIGAGMSETAGARGAHVEELAGLERAIENENLDSGGRDRVRDLIAQARRLYAEGDDDASAEAMAAALDLIERS